jgi:hypothetical protein
LSYNNRILVGALCDNYQRDSRRANAMARYQKLPEVRALREAREALAGKTAQGVARVVKAEIRPRIREAVKVSVRIKRGKTRVEILKMISDHCINKLGLRGVTPRRVEACWKEYRALLKARDLISARVLETGGD